MSPRNSTPTLRDLITADPGLPYPNPTTPYWISDPGPHPLANTSSPQLPETADVVIIGSGITGTSIAFHLLQEGPPDLRVTVLEARSLCSGATGRNGGHLVTYGAVLYSSLKQMLGRELAYKVLNFTFQNVDAVADAVQRYAPQEAGYRALDRVMCHGDEEGFAEAKRSVEEFERDYPEQAGRYTFLSPEKVKESYGIHGVAGAIKFAAGALSPYRFIMKIWETLLARYPDNLTVEAHTPATNVTQVPICSPDHKYRYRVHTPRGVIRTANVIYATNAYTGHLLPTIRGHIWPFRETMTVQGLSNKIPNRGVTTSWSVHQDPVYNSTSGKSETGTLYLQQNPRNGDFYFGGAYANAEEALTSDDSGMTAQGTAYLRKELSQLFGLNQHDKTRLVSEWTGIQGFTADGAPLAGPLPFSVTRREGGREWIAAGYNGGGMALCWRMGKAIAGMLRGEDVSEWFPEVFYATEERLESTLAVDVGVAGIKEYFPDYREQ
ncbi:FAD dependent oxidoreductase [Aspergillus caelatus]|uniref:FAD dependent oxidoreductase n=1 Tax=Aspergillus caelatus TaxID=61420 RepID=A0A5N6ZKK9_9EURO|nr:FAD dependent oxidoreductase [Aspergillus caelatus]KAE8357496.1 FAD dependent oxidoreductase [Aspergillus caelatus]